MVLNNYYLQYTKSNKCNCNKNITNTMAANHIIEIISTWQPINHLYWVKSISTYDITFNINYTIIINNIK